MKDALRQIRDRPIFASPVPFPPKEADRVLEEVLAGADASLMRDPVDRRVVEGVRDGRHLDPLRSQAEVGGWPDLGR